MRKGFTDGFVSLAVLGVASMLATACGNDPIPIDAFVPEIDGQTCTGTIPFLELCMNDAECMTCKCVLLGHQKHCTKQCTGPADCPAPSTGCVNNRCEL